MPQSQVGSGNSANSSGTPTGTTTSAPIPGPVTATTWNFLAVNATSITINVSNLDNAYLVGTPVEKYLSVTSGTLLPNFTNIEYCVVTDFSVGGVKSQLRTRSVPFAYYDYIKKRVVRSFRVDFDDDVTAASTCLGVLKIQDSGGSYITDGSFAGSPKFKPRDLCPSCTSPIFSTRVRIFKKDTSGIFEVPLPSINLTGLNLVVDPNYNALGSAGECTNTICKTRGYDCCLDNQCVDDGTVRPSASTTYSAQFAAAEQEKITNPLAYFNYPQIYYVCGSNVLNAPTSSTNTSPIVGVDYVAGFEQLKKDYNCIQHIKGQATVTPFHNEILSRVAPYTAATDCLTSSSDAANLMYFQTVVKRLYTTCGCAKTALADMITSCPAYDYTVVLKDTLNVPTRIDCLTPENPVIIPTVQTVTLSGRSAPHRFFESINGLEKNILGTERTYVSNGVTLEHFQEGDKFEYLDDGKIIPVQQEFSMNAVLGPMTVNLTQALPAKLVNVAVDQVYLISTTGGFFTPCPTCAKDSWLGSFTAFPSSSTGTGLQAVGHTTERDTLSTNYTGGNYEDTIFGRACWIPPTMLPYSHSHLTNIRDQRLNRLQTQATLYINGYQRDWYGFNKGALIGSFDGVTWFAIGKGRIVKSSSRKLFLAINAPFADLSTPTLHTVQVQNYDGLTRVAQLDYDPEFDKSHPYQNEAANCQQNHMCATDADCITRLGWEYVCNDVKDIKTQWPIFDADGKELSGKAEITLDQILQQRKFPALGGTRRCIYRGAGAPCIKTPQVITNITTRKNLTCAPNFHCALVTAGAAFNAKLSRYAAPLEEIPVARNHLIGKDANILGRPLDYILVTEGKSLPGGVSATLLENVAKYEPLASADLGLCQPGKKLTSINPYEQHRGPDTLKRTDYISQIGPCNSGKFDNDRYTSCPSLTSEGNYEIFDVANLKTEAPFPLFAQWKTGIATDYNKRTRAQNACGLDSIKTGTSLATPLDTLSALSPFVTIEAKPLTTGTVNDPTMARDACMRRAGAVCHTDLDCSPNKFHANQVDNFDVNYFGGTIAEQNYYREYLVCGQGQSKPFPSDSLNFKTFNMSKNRCCREVGKDLTTFTANIPSGFAGTSIDPATAGLITLDPPGLKPSQAKRYSRLVTVDDLSTGGSRPILDAKHARSAAGALLGTNNIGTPNQWRTLNEANNDTCCGGAWIRKFSDGTTDWTKRNRLVIDPSNFKCINSRTVLLTEPKTVAEYYGFIAPATYGVGGDQDLANLLSSDSFNYCQDSTGASGSCALWGFASSVDVILPTSAPYPTKHVTPTTLDTGEMTLNTAGQIFSRNGNPSWSPMAITGNEDVYFMPESADSDPNTRINYSDTSPTARRNLAIQIPSYIPRKGFDDVITTIAVFLAEGSPSTRRFPCKYDASIAGFGAIQNTPTRRDLQGTVICEGDPSFPIARCCYDYDPSSRILTIVGNDAYTLPVTTTPAFPGREFEINGYQLGAFISFGAAGGGPTLGNKSDGTPLPTIPRTYPGSDSYYLKRFAKLELSGIPQIMIEPIFCNDNADRIVPGIFKPTITTKAIFNQVDNSFLNPSFSPLQSTERATTHHALESEPVFSANDFKCCTPLGKFVDNADKCCSGSAAPFGTNGTAFTCNLPRGTNLMVYFNRFVSNEGVDKDGPGGGLKTETDFDARTGELLLTTAVNEKVRQLGNAFCASGRTTTGGLFGNFLPEPIAPVQASIATFYHMTDSPRDYQAGTPPLNGNKGYGPFGNGYRWNHHIYCDD